MDDLKGKGRHRNLKQEALDRTLLRTRFGSSDESVARQIYAVNEFA